MANGFSKLIRVKSGKNLSLQAVRPAPIHLLGIVAGRELCWILEPHLVGGEYFIPDLLWSAENTEEIN
jgi:hypothetical protein